MLKSIPRIHLRWHPCPHVSEVLEKEELRRKPSKPVRIASRPEKARHAIRPHCATAAVRERAVRKLSNPTNRNILPARPPKPSEETVHDPKKRAAARRRNKRSHRRSARGRQHPRIRSKRVFKAVHAKRLLPQGRQEAPTHSTITPENSIQRL